MKIVPCLRLGFTKTFFLDTLYIGISDSIINTWYAGVPDQPDDYPGDEGAADREGAQAAEDGEGDPGSAGHCHAGSTTGSSIANGFPCAQSYVWLHEKNVRKFAHF